MCQRRPGRAYRLFACQRLGTTQLSVSLLQPRDKVASSRRLQCSSKMQANLREQGCSKHSVRCTGLGCCIRHPTDALPSACRFLEQQCLLSELQSLLCTLQADKHSDQGLHDVLGTTHGLDAPSAAAVASLAKHLSAASLIQQLQLPDVTAQTNPFNTLHQQQDSSSSSSGACHIYK